MNEELKVIISAEVADYTGGIEGAKQGLLDFKKQVEQAKPSVDSSMRAMGTACMNAGKAIAKGIALGATALIALAASTKDYREGQAQLATAFETAGGSAESAAATYNDLYRVLGDDGKAVEAASHIAQLTTEQAALSEWTTICEGVYATFGDSLPIESLTEAANETAKTGQLTGALADALNWAGISEDDFAARLAECNSEAEREQLIRETLNGLYSEAAATYEENNAAVLAQNEAQASLQATLAALGEAIAPIITTFTSFANDVLAVIVPYIQQLAETYGPALQAVLESVATALESALTWALEHKELLLVIGGIIAIVVAAIAAYNAVAAIKNAMAAAEVTSVWGLVTAYLAHAAAVLVALAPYLLIVAAIAAVIAIIVLCVVYWDEIKEAAAGAWEWIKEKWAAAGEWFGGIVDSIKSVFSSIGAWFKNIFSTAWNGIKAAWSSVKSWFSGIWTKIKGVFAAVGSWFSGIFSGAWEKIKGAFSAVGSFFQGIWDSITGIFSNVGETIGGAIKGVVTTAINTVISTAVKIINGFISAINFAIGIINLIPGVNIGKITPLSAPAMAKGGVVDSATLALIGENGKEAVVPLENNIGWMDKLATMLTERMGGTGGSAPIVLEVDGKVFAQTAITTMNQLTRQSGTLGLNII